MKPKVDITEAGGSRWTMGKLISDALSDNREFLTEFNSVAEDGSEDDVIATLLKYADLLFEGETMIEGKSEDLVLSEDPEQLTINASEYLAGVKTMTIEDVGYESTVVFLADVKATLSAIDAKRKDLTKGARETVAKINAEFKPAADAYAAAEKILKDKIVEFRADVRSIRNRMLSAGEDPVEPVPEVDGVSVREKWEIVSIDEDALPDEFWISVPNEKMILASVKEGAAVLGVVADVVESLAITHSKVRR